MKLGYDSCRSLLVFYWKQKGSKDKDTNFVRVTLLFDQATGENQGSETEKKNKRTLKSYKM